MTKKTVKKSVWWVLFENDRILEYFTNRTSALKERYALLDQLPSSRLRVAKVIWESGQ